MADMLELMYPGRSKVYISDGIGKKLASMKEKRNVVRYSMIAEDYRFLSERDRRRTAKQI